MKIVSRGSEFRITKKQLEEPGISLVYAPNGIGKTSLADAFKEISGDVSRTEDLINGVSSDVEELRVFVNGSGRELHVIDSEFSNESIAKSKRGVVLSKFASDIANLENENSKIYKNAWRKGDIKDIADSEFEFGKSATLSLLSNKEFVAENDPDIYHKYPILKTIKSASEFIEFKSKVNEFIPKYEELYAQLLTEISNTVSLSENKKGINVKNTESWFDFIEAYETHINTCGIGDKGLCPICDSDVESHAAIIEETRLLIEAVEDSIASAVEEIIDLVSGAKLASFIQFDVQDTIKGKKMDCSQIETLKNVINDMDYEKASFAIMFEKSPTFRKYIINRDKLIEYRRELPMISESMEVKFNKIINNSFTYKNSDIDISLKLNTSRNEIDVIIGGVDNQKDVLSKSMVTVLTLAYRLALIEGGNNMIIIDDITDSNDILNVGYIATNLISELSAAGTVILFTHDINFVEEIARRMEGENA